MLNVYTTKQIKEMENAAFKSNVTVETLIDRAAAALIKSVRGDSVSIVCGNGGNGCDGFCAALKLREQGKSVRVYKVGGEPSETLAPYVREYAKSGEVLDVFSAKDVSADTVIDCVFGFGVNRELGGEYARAVELINNASGYVVSADIPSGLNSDSGEVMGVCVRADKTVTFNALKTGLLLGEAKNFVGEIEVADIGLNHIEPIARLIERADVAIPKRSLTAHKGDFGRVKIIGGSATMPGAPLIAFNSAVAAMRCGSGLTTLCVARSMKGAYQSRVTECMLEFLPDDDGIIRYDGAALDALTVKTNAIALGMGMTANPELKRIAEHLLNFSGTLVLDADALNVFSRDVSSLKNHKCKLILTPHVGEFVRLTEIEPTVDNAKIIARELDCVVALKSAATIVTDGDAVYINTLGTPAQSKGGSGDALSGMIAALSCVMPPVRAAYTACARLGLAALKATEVRDENSVLASDVIDCIGKF